mmetsp:Transcript_14116/g.28429  ORF Transcript_14116/g.28429 Transcript_14116/m.28429 type:complete len:125 (-) Transcript_14116:294-668(-)
MNGFAWTWASVFLALFFVRNNKITRNLLPIPSAPPDDDDGFGAPTTTYHAAADATDGFSSSFDVHGLGSGSASWAGKGQPAMPPVQAAPLASPVQHALQQTLSPLPPGSQHTEHKEFRRTNEAS